MHDAIDDDEPNVDDAFACAETFASEVIKLGQHNSDLCVQIETAEKYLVRVKAATTLEQAQRIAREYFGEELPF
jgi:hypothetical protein